MGANFYRHLFNAHVCVVWVEALVPVRVCVLRVCVRSGTSAGPAEGTRVFHHKRGNGIVRAVDVLSEKPYTIRSTQSAGHIGSGTGAHPCHIGSGTGAHSLLHRHRDWGPPPAASAPGLSAAWLPAIATQRRASCVRHGACVSPSPPPFGPTCGSVCACVCERVSE
jgi:hypothetical protein